MPGTMLGSKNAGTIDALLTLSFLDPLSYSRPFWRLLPSVAQALPGCVLNAPGARRLHPHKARHILFQP